MELTKYIQVQLTTVEEMKKQKTIREIISRTMDKQSDVKASTAKII